MIRGVAYDLTDFIDKHPGGAFMIRQAVGRDATSLFESYHVRSSITDAQLAKLPKVTNPGIKADKGPFPNDSEFYVTVKSRVLKEVLKGKAQRGGMEIYIMITLAISLLAYYNYIFLNTWSSAIILGFVGAHIGMTLNHCANHGGLTKYPALNYFLGLISFFFRFYFLCFFDFLISLFISLFSCI